MHFFFGTAWRAPLVLVVLAAFALGLAVGALGMVPRWWKHRGRRPAARTHGMAVPAAERRRTRPCTMDFDLSWVLWGLPIAFVLGWLASRLDLRQLRIENRQAPKAYFRGLNFLLNEQQDQAIDAFIEAVQKDPDTSELHFALGNLFRRRGEYERAVRVHEHLLSRGDLSRADRHRAQHALALDFLKAGLLDRAEEALRKLEGTAFEGQALPALLAIYERTRDWAQASEVARQARRQRARAISAARSAHYLCEQAASAEPRTRPSSCCAQAMRGGAATRPAPGSSWPRCNGGPATPAAPADPAGHGSQCGPASPCPDRHAADRSGRGLRPAGAGAGAAAAQLRAAPSLDVLEAIVALQPDRSAEARELVHAALHARSPRWWPRPSGWPARSWSTSSSMPRCKSALTMRVKPLTRYRCAACGFEAKQHFWQCPGCQAWDSYPPRRVEEL